MKKPNESDKNVERLLSRIASLEEENIRLRKENDDLKEALEFSERMFVRNEIKRNEHEREMAEYIESLEGKLK